MPAKLERCVRAVKRKQTNVNPWAVCKASINKKRKIYTGPRGGKYIVKNGRKVYLN